MIVCIAGDTRPKSRRIAAGPKKIRIASGRWALPLTRPAAPKSRRRTAKKIAIDVNIWENLGSVSARKSDTEPS